MSSHKQASAPLCVLCVMCAGVMRLPLGAKTCVRHPRGELQLAGFKHANGYACGWHNQTSASMHSADAQELCYLAGKERGEPNNAHELRMSTLFTTICLTCSGIKAAVTQHT